MAILKRKKPRKVGKQFREALWPTQGWKRTYHYYRHRVFRTGDSTYKITAGLATGVAVSWTPFYGTHFAQAMFFSWCLRASMIAGFIGTIWGNPWTFSFIFWLAYKLGVTICGWFGLNDFIALPASFNLDYFIDNPADFFTYLFSHPLKLLLPITLGGYLCGILSWPVAYALLYYPVRIIRKTYRKQRFARFKKRQERRAGKQKLKSEASGDK